MTSPNPSTALARTLMDELHRNGVDYAVVSPGSRSAALAIAANQHPGIETTVVLDERSAGFHALGRSLATGRPAIAIATSGTAVANYLPAVVEADVSCVPVIFITADRPPELLGVGANQTIDQVKIFGSRVRQFALVGPVDGSIDQNGLWRSLMSQTVARAQGHGGKPGPVHVNVAFREPTVPVSDDGRTSATPYPFPTTGREDGGPWQRHSISPPTGSEPWGLCPKRGLVIAGQGDYDRDGLLEAAAAGNWPILATAASGLRSSKDVVTTYHHLLVGEVPGSLNPDLVVTVGRIGPSDRLSALTALSVPQVQVDRWGLWQDPRRHSTHLIQGDPAHFLSGLGVIGTDWIRAWLEADDAMARALDDTLDQVGTWTGPGLARAISGIQARLVVASSMPIRDVDAHMRVTGRGVYANRGASGIDGFVSTALGVGSTGVDTLAVSGDLSFLHDLGGLVSDHLPPVVFIVVDNGGGGLFDLLPQAEHAPDFDRLFYAPHHRNLESLAIAHGLEVTTLSDLHHTSEVFDAKPGGGPRAILVPVDRETDQKARKTLDAEARLVVSGLS
ncbi:MAG: 2-succinyl-5-enolpyruvyl-6-hydroxy-3-cyclohexene-1-carboxylic-acid synthase [Acidimicrobiia bacterium]